MIGLNIGAALMAMTLRIPEKQFEEAGWSPGMPARAGARPTPRRKADERLAPWAFLAPLGTGPERRYQG
jgi:hypothetical protein